MKKILFYIARIIITGFLLLLFINYVHYMYSNDLNNIIEGKIYDTVTPGEVILKDAASIQTIVPLNDGMYQLSIPFFVDTKGNAKDIIGSVHVLLYDRYNTQIFYEELPLWYFTIPSYYPFYFEEPLNRKEKYTCYIFIESEDPTVISAGLCEEEMILFYSNSIDYVKMNTCIGLALFLFLIFILPFERWEFTNRLFGLLTSIWLPFLLCIVGDGISNNTFENIRNGTAFLLNIGICYSIWIALFIVIGRTRWTNLITTLLIGVMGYVDYFVQLFRGSPFIPSDITGLQTAASVIGNYDFKMTPQLLFSTSFFLFCILIGIRFNFSVKEKRYRSINLLIGTIMIFLFYAYLMDTDVLAENDLKLDQWNPTQGRNLNGFYLNFYMNYQNSNIKKPEGYTKAKAQELLNEHPYNEIDDMVKPNIILILSESYADLSVLGAVETSSDYMSYYNSLTENVIKGNLYTSVLGGLTANSEFEILTGDTMAFLPTGSVAFTQQVKREMSTIASTLSSKGYDIVAIHPQPANNWKRNAVYPLLGINHFIDQKAFEGGEYVRSYISDEYLFQKMIEVFEKKEEEPLFLYAITMQNHGGYGLEGNETVTITNMTDVESAAKFVDLMNITDQALPTLIDYFSEYEEPTIICMYGDHQPALTDSFYNQAYALSGITSEEEKITRKYITPFMIWANYDIEEKEIEAMSANYLGAYLLEVAGLELPSYYQYLLNMYQTLPVISAIQLQDAEGTIYLNGQDHPYTEIIKNYQILQYYHLFDS